MRKRITALLLAVLLAGCSNSTLFDKQKAVQSDDVTGPYINLSTYVFSTVKGKPIDFSNITGYDDVDGMMPVSLSGYVNYSKAGEYYPSLVCTDTSGNTTSQVITITVLEENAPTPPTDAKETAAPAAETPEPETCEEAGAEDKNYACSTVLPSAIESYIVIYESEAGREACEMQAEIQNEDGGEAVCETIVRNNGQFWGYGLKDE